MPLRPSAPSEVPFNVNLVTPDDPVRTSIVSFPVNVSFLPLPSTLPAGPVLGSSLPSTQTFSQARPPSTDTTRLTPLNATVTARVNDVVLPSGLEAVTVIAHLPAVSANGALNVPSSPTSTVTGLGSAGGTGVAPPLDVVAGPVYAALTTTEPAFVVRPRTGIAPFSYVALSAGLSTGSVGALTTPDGD